ncbi:MAG: hypothetical protein M0P61_02595 [Ignavibacteriaceae bacterium]|jgi:hypothetical protein|nr:hypothetical protein [Ignavibacteriaceae bacterium]
MLKRLFFAIVILTTAQSFSQPYLALHAGYGLSAASEVINTKSIDNGHQNVYGTLGSGLHFGGAIGFMMHENFGLELGLTYTKGSSMDGNYKSSGRTYDQKVYGNYLGIAPSVIVQTKADNVRPYAKFGFVLALPGATEEQSTYSGTQKGEYSGGMALGYTGAAGLNLGTDRMQLFIELALTSLSWAPAKVKYSDASGHSIEYDLKDEDPAPSSNPTSVRLSQTIPFSNIALNVGIKVGF